MNLKKKQIILPFLILISITGIVGGIMANKQEPKKNPPKKDVAFVTTVPAQSIQYTFKILSQGVATPQYSTSIVAQVSGEIIDLSSFFVKGGKVKKGDLLAQIDPFNYQVKLEQAKASLASARASFILERAQGQVAEAEWAKISQAAPSELGLRKPQQEQALAAVKAAQAGLNQAQKDLERTRILAPYDAIIQNRLVSPGSFVTIGTTVGQLLGIEKAEIRLPVKQIDIGFLENNGHDAMVNLEGVVDGKPQRWQAKVTRTEGIIDSDTRMLHMIAEIKDPYRLLQTSANPQKDVNPLPFGTYVTATIYGKQLDNAFIVPRNIIRDDHLPMAVDGKLSYKPVNVVRNEGSTSIITKGIKNGEQIVTSALDHPIDGMNIDWEGNSKSTIDVSQPTSGAE